MTSSRKVRPPSPTAPRILSFSGEVKIGDLLTVSTILISLASVLVSWDIDRKLRQAKEANDIRAAAATTLGDLERRNALSLSLYTDAQSTFVAVSQIASSSVASREVQLVNARDQLWRGLSEIHTAILARTVDEKLESGYVRLLSYYPTIRKLYQETLSRLRSADSEMLEILLRETELSIMSLGKKKHELTSAEVGNALRAASRQVELQHREILRSEMNRVDLFLTEKIEATDYQLLHRQE